MDKPEYYPENYQNEFNQFLGGLYCSTLEIPPDWYYILQFIAFKPEKQLTPEQRKQWESYMPEIMGLFHLLFSLCPEKVNLIMIKEETNKDTPSTIGINFKLKDLHTIGQFSKKSFGAMITALNRFVPALWACTVVSLGSAGLMKSTENSN